MVTIDGIVKYPGDIVYNVWRDNQTSAYSVNTHKLLGDELQDDFDEFYSEKNECQKVCDKLNSKIK